MPPPPGHEPVADDEILYRRVPVSRNWYSPASGLSPQAFDPRDDEHTGISIDRAKYKSLTEVAAGKSKQGYFVAVFRAGDLRARGIQVLPSPESNDPGHAELPQLTCHNRDQVESLERQSLLTALPISVEGPFVSG